MAKYLKTIMLMVELEGMVTYKYVVFSYPLAVLVLVISKEILHKPSEGIDLHVHGKKIFIAFIHLN